MPLRTSRTASSCRIQPTANGWTTTSSLRVAGVRRERGKGRDLLPRWPLAAGRSCSRDDAEAAEIVGPTGDVVARRESARAASGPRGLRGGRRERRAGGARARSATRRLVSRSCLSGCARAGGLRRCHERRQSPNHSGTRGRRGAAGARRRGSRRRTGQEDRQGQEEAVRRQGQRSRGGTIPGRARRPTGPAGAERRRPNVRRKRRDRRRARGLVQRRG